MSEFPPWVKEARPSSVLGPHERPHYGRFRKMYVEIVKSHAVDPRHPTQLELIACRSIAAAAWRMFAWTDDAKFLEQEVWARGSYSAARRSEYLNQYDRSKMVRLSLDQMKMYQDSLVELRNGILVLDEDDVIEDEKVIKLKVARK